MTSNEPTEAEKVQRRRWWMLWRWSPGSYRGRRDRLSPEAQADAASYSIRGGL